MSIEARFPLVTLRCPLGTVSTDQVEVTAAVNAFTSVRFSAFAGKEAAVSSNRVFDSGAAALMGRAQTIGFSFRESPDTTVTINDGGSGTVSFSGYLVSPSYMMNRQALNPGFAAVSSGSILGSLRLDIYSPRQASRDAPLTEGTEMPQYQVKDSSLADRLSNLTKYAIDIWKDNFESGSSSVLKEIAEQRHAINERGPLKAWYQLLKDSSGHLNMPWLKKMAECESVNGRFNQMLLDMLLGVSRDFNDVISGLCEMFQLIHVPGSDGGPGYLVKADSAVTGEATELMLPATSIFLQGNLNHDLLPVRQVIIRGLPEPGTEIVENLTDYQFDNQTYAVCAFPPDADSSAGEPVIRELPPWIPEITAAFDVSPGSGAGAPDPDNLISGVNRISTLVQRYNVALIDEIIEDYARQVYINATIGNTSTSVEIPADVTLWPGRRYRVVNASGEHLFTGFMSGIRHSFSRSGQGGSAFTTCNFTHILFPGFTLPGL